MEINRDMIELNHELSIERQCELLGKTRSWYYYTPFIDLTRVNQDNLYIEAILDVHHMYPFYGYRKINQELLRQGCKAGRKRVYRLMRETGICAIYPGPNLSKARHDHKKYPYLLRNLSITRPNQVWQTDISYIKLPTGIVYLTAILDVYSRKVLAWNISNTMDTSFCLFCLMQAVMLYGLPEIVNTDQGSQFTSEEFITYLENNGISISMDGKGRALDNVYIERLWRSVKYEYIFLMSIETLETLRKGLTEYFEFYNMKRVHQSLEYKTPSEVYDSSNKHDEQIEEVS
jgi:putative transposase